MRSMISMWIMCTLCRCTAGLLTKGNDHGLAFPFPFFFDSKYLYFSPPIPHPFSLSFLFRSARTSCTTFGWSRPVRPSRPSRPQEKSGSLIYRHICLMNHEKTHQTNPMAQWDPLDALVTPWDPLATPKSTPSDP